MEGSAHEAISSVGLPTAWEDRAPSPPPHASYLQGINIPSSPQNFSEYFQDTIPTSLPQDPMEFMMLPLATFSHLETTEYAGSLPTDPLASQQQFDDNNITSSFSMELAMSSHSKTGVSGTRKLLPTDSVASQSNSQSVLAAAAAADAAQNPQQSKPLSRHQIYRLNVKAKAKFKDLSNRIQKEHIKMLNEEVLRMRDELKTKDAQLSLLSLENHKLREENKRLKLPSLRIL